MPQYKLTYFNFAALAEPIRWAFKLADVPFDDERIELDDWQNVKKSGRFPTENLPLLEIDGEVYTQSNAILRYLGHKFGMDLEDDILNLRMDQALDIVTDARIAFRAILLEQDPDKKAVIKDELANEKLPLFLKQLETLVIKTEGDYLAGSKLTVADLVIAHWTSLWNKILETDLLQNFPGLTRLREAVLTLPQIDAWIQERPQTQF